MLTLVFFCQASNITDLPWFWLASKRTVKYGLSSRSIYFKGGGLPDPLRQAMVYKDWKNSWLDAWVGWDGLVLHTLVRVIPGIHNYGLSEFLSIQTRKISPQWHSCIHGKFIAYVNKPCYGFLHFLIIPLHLDMRCSTVSGSFSLELPPFLSLYSKIERVYCRAVPYAPCDLICQLFRRHALHCSRARSQSRQWPLGFLRYRPEKIRSQLHEHYNISCHFSHIIRGPTVQPLHKGEVESTLTL